jgi:hypothetical protein
VLLCTYEAAVQYSIPYGPPLREKPLPDKIVRGRRAGVNKSRSTNWFGFAPGKKEPARAVCAGERAGKRQAVVQQQSTAPQNLFVWQQGGKQQKKIGW